MKFYEQLQIAIEPISYINTKTRQQMLDTEYVTYGDIKLVLADLTNVSAALNVILAEMQQRDV